ncbi:hypothetical protein PM082_012442 [Marasmius tenuissimus]|nr:hypothetical protein PM082_012442 [Marasmius tenuissimus]
MTRPDQARAPLTKPSLQYESRIHSPVVTRRHAEPVDIGNHRTDNEAAFSFLEPDAVIRASHLIPQFSAGKTNDLLETTSPTAARLAGETDDWVNYYVNIFVDRDMFMRYHGGGIGHLDTGLSCQAYEADADGQEFDGAEESTPELDRVNEGLCEADKTEANLRENPAILDDAGSSSEDEEREASGDETDMEDEDTDEAGEEDDSDSDYGEL